MVLHDPTLARVQGRPEPVDAIRADALADLGVPTLADVLQSAGRRAFLDVELKVDPGPVAVEILAAGRGPELHRAVVSSFDRGALEGRRSSRTDLAALAQHEDPRCARSWPRRSALGCRGVSVDWRALDARSIALARDAGLEVAAWTVRRRSTFDRLARLGVVAICAEGAALDG